MRTINVFLLCILSLGIGLSAKAQNIAYTDAQARFTVITDGTVRMEWSSEGKFCDAPSFVASERSYPHCDFKVRETGAKVEITTSLLKLTYRKDSGRFSEANLSVKYTGSDTSFVWKPGMVQKRNLKGTLRTLDRMNGDVHTDWSGNKTVKELEEGILARDGWTLIDDSGNFVFDGSEWAWVEEREAATGDKDALDWYFMGYGADYKKALKDFTVFAGKVPLPPRYAFGYWWSRYWAYSDNEYRSLVGDFKNYDIPLDVMVIDMDWHYTTKGLGGWTGWTWNRRLFPDYRKFLGWLKGNDVQVTLNLHPADGVKPYEECYEAVARDTGTPSGVPVKWVNSDKRFMNAMFRNVFHPMQKDGVDFWWLDWQQHLTDTNMEGLSNTFWINYCFFSDMERNGSVRPMLYHRWGGLGNHRYQVGFSGDAIISWKTLDYQPYFNSTASNVLYGYWSHDLGGHDGGKLEPELYTRWLQFGAVSPIMRTHSGKSPHNKKEPWNFGPEYFKVMRATIKQRYSMAPYIYTMARKAYEEGLSLCRPLYYDWPREDDAYSFRNEYMFGDDILVAPVTSPRSGDGYSYLNVWLPEGEWYEWHTGDILSGGGTHERKFAIDEYPLYFRSGAIVPMFGEDVKNLRDVTDEKVYITVFPGKSGNAILYEDNGNDKDYASEFATTALDFVRSDNMLEVRIGGREGEYPGMAQTRKLAVAVECSMAPVSVSVDGKDSGFGYDGNNLLLTVEVPETSASESHIIKVTYGSDTSVEGLKGKFHRFQKAVMALKQQGKLDPIGEEIGFLESTGLRMTYDPANAEEYIRYFNETYPLVELEGFKKATAFRNPISDRVIADPYVLRDEDADGKVTYWACMVSGNGLGVSGSDRLSEINPPKRVWNAVGDGWNRQDVWAPELFHINDENGDWWYIYYAAGNPGDKGGYGTQRTGVLRAKEPMGPYEDMGMIYTGNDYKPGIIPTVDNTIYAIDMTTFELDGQRYAVWSGNVSETDGNQRLYIATMENPWTINSSRVEISKADRPWELVNRQINEGPAMLFNPDSTKLFIVYSCNGSWTDKYRLGWLELDLTKPSKRDPMVPSNWKKSSDQVFYRCDNTSRKSGEAGVNGVGHNTFTKSPDGKEDWIVYHAMKYADGGWGQRYAFAQKFIWDKNGRPVFGTPVSWGETLKVPSGE